MKGCPHTDGLRLALLYVLNSEFSFLSSVSSEKNPGNCILLSSNNP